MATWINFIDHGMPFGKKTHLWSVVPNDGGPEIGEVKWYGPWRKYCFFPMFCTVFEEACLRDIAAFCERQTRDHRAAKAA